LIAASLAACSTMGFAADIKTLRASLLGAHVSLQNSGLRHAIWLPAESKSR
jgi:hypothetical protein